MVAAPRPAHAAFSSNGSSAKVTGISAPMADPSAEMLSAIGGFSLAWSMLEMGLDLCVMMVFHHFGGKEMGVAPRALSSKIKLLRKCIVKAEGLRPYCAQITGLLRRVNEMTEFRHQVTHGVASSSENGDALIFVRIIHDDNGFHTAQTQVITSAKVLASWTETRALAHEALSIGLTLASSVAPPGFYDDIDNTFGKLRI